MRRITLLTPFDCAQGMPVSWLLTSVFRLLASNFSLLTSGRLLTRAARIFLLVTRHRSALLTALSLSMGSSLVTALSPARLRLLRVAFL